MDAAIDVLYDTKSPLAAWLFMAIYINGDTKVANLAEISGSNRKAVSYALEALDTNGYICIEAGIVRININSSNYDTLSLQATLEYLPTPNMLANELIMINISDLNRLYELFGYDYLSSALINLVAIAKHTMNKDMAKKLTRIIKQHAPAVPAQSQLVKQETENKVEFIKTELNKTLFQRRFGI